MASSSSERDEYVRCCARLAAAILMAGTNFTAQEFEDQVERIFRIARAPKGKND